MKVTNSIIAAMLLLSSACSAKVDHKLVEEDAALPPAAAWGEASPRTGRKLRLGKEVREARRAARRITLPLQVAVHLSQPNIDQWRWNVNDRGTIATWGRELKKEGIVKDMFVMSSLVSTGNSLDEIRLAASRHGADAVLVIRGSAELDSGWNPLALFYLTGVGYYIFPGSNAEAFMAMRGALLDVESGRPLVSVEAEGQGSTWGPGGWIEPERALMRAKAATIAEFGKKYQSGMRAFAKVLSKKRTKTRKRQAPRPKRVPRSKRTPRYRIR